MLILERKLNEIISIETPSGDIIDIHLIESDRNKAKIGIAAPNDYLILRDELIDEQEVDTTH